jgi:tetratricopeptide (TPR) repeat protein
LKVYNKYEFLFVTDEAQYRIKEKYKMDCFEFLDQNQEAIVYLNEYINKNPYSEIAWHQLGRLHYGVKEYENAIRAFDYATLIDDEFLGLGTLIQVKRKIIRKN